MAKSRVTDDFVGAKDSLGRVSTVASLHTTNWQLCSDTMVRKSVIV